MAYYFQDVVMVMGHVVANVCMHTSSTVHGPAPTLPQLPHPIQVTSVTDSMGVGAKG